MSKMIIIRGIPGSGKTTFANKKFKGVYHIENDMFLMQNGVYNFSIVRRDQAIQWCLKSTEIALRMGVDIVVSNTFTKKRYVDVYHDLAARYNVDVEVYRMMGHFDNVHNVPREVLNNMIQTFEDYPNETKIYPED